MRADKSDSRQVEAASAPSNVLPFPQTKRALWHRSRGMDAAGYLSLLQLEREGEAFPANVQRLDEPNGAALPERSPELLLALLIWDSLPAKQRERVKQSLRCLAYGKPADPCAVKLNNLLNRHG
jgi:hypothetical protein